MIKFGSIFIMLFIQKGIYAQNLVINGSFEELYDSCCTTSNKNKYWNLLDNYNDKAPWIELFQEGSSRNEGTPGTSIGYQKVKDGKSFAGIGLYDNIDEVREYLVGSLSSPLRSGEKYRVEFYISLADCSRYAVNSIGVAFSNDSILKRLSRHNLYLVTDVSPSVEYSGSVLKDTANWVLVVDSFVAKGGEDKIVVGCFKSDDYITIEKQRSQKKPKCQSFGIKNSAYYFIDKISVEILY